MQPFWHWDAPSVSVLPPVQIQGLAEVEDDREFECYVFRCQRVLIVALSRMPLSGSRSLVRSSSSSSYVDFRLLTEYVSRLFDLVHDIFICQGIWHYLVLNWGNKEELDHLTW